MKTIITFFYLLIFTALSSQNLSITYELKRKQSNNSIKTEIYNLDILNKKSVFRTPFRKKSDSLLYKNGLGYGYDLNIDKQIYIQKNLETNEIKKTIIFPIMRDRFVIKMTDSLNWKILPETKKIGSFNCNKVELKYGGRNWTGWFTDEIQIYEGPYIFYGLPGLIVQINDSNYNFDFQLSEIKKNTEDDLYIPKDGKETSSDYYKKIRNDYYNDPFSYIKLLGIKAMEDDGNGGMKKIDFRSKTETIRKTLDQTIPIEID